MTRVERREAAAPAVRYGQAHQCAQVTREQRAQALFSYCAVPSPGDVGAAFYRARVGGVPHTQTRLRLRDAYLPALNSALAAGDRLCVGGPVALLAVARGGTRRSRREPDFVLIQERSARALNVMGKLAGAPKAFHGPTVEPAKEASLSASLERELEEELLGREDLEHLSESSCRQADPFHPDRLSEPMRGYSNAGRPTPTGWNASASGSTWSRATMSSPA